MTYFTPNGDLCHHMKADT